MGKIRTHYPQRNSYALAATIRLWVWGEINRLVNVTFVTAGVCVSCLLLIVSFITLGRLLCLCMNKFVPYIVFVIISLNIISYIFGYESQTRRAAPPPSSIWRFPILFYSIFAGDVMFIF